MKLLARNLARTTTEAELKVLFETYGKVQYCTLATDKETGKSKGFAFIEMPRPGDAKAAVKNLNGKDVAGNKIRVKKAEAKKPEPKQPDQIKPVQNNTAVETAATENTEPGQDKAEHDTQINPGIWSK